MALICLLALDTGMRLSELPDIRVGQVKRTRGGRYIHRPDSKNGHARKVVLNTRVAAGLHFHDLRHEGLSRMAEKGLAIGELAEQSGHRTAQVLLRYVNINVSEVSQKFG